jgi:hypothetical protein
MLHARTSKQTIAGGQCACKKKCADHFGGGDYCPGNTGEESHPPIIYPVAATKSKSEAAKYLAFLTTPEAKAVFERYGFRVLARSSQ